MKQAWRLLRLSFAAFVPLVGATAQLRTTALFGDHMVLPAERQVVVRGTAAAGATVSLAPWWSAPVAGTAGLDGRFAVPITTPARGARGELELRCGDERLVLRDVLVGDVWLASGQSNMEMTVVDGDRGVDDWRTEVAAADWPELRFFTVARQTAAAPAADVEGQWQVCSPATVGACSAVGYFFARELVLRRQGPIGLVVSSWGGTRAEAWTSPDGLAAFPELVAEAAERAGDRTSLAARRQQFFDAVDAAPLGPGVATQLPERWSATELRGFDGVCDYVRRVALPASFVGRDLDLSLGPIDDMDTVFWNGERIAGSERDGVWNTPRRYRVPAAVVSAQQAELRVRVVDTGGEGGFAGAPGDLLLEIPGGVAGVEWLPLAGEWQRHIGPALRELPRWARAGDGANEVSALWHGMIAPLLPFPFRGVIWYQGEANRDTADRYSRLFPAMIEDWRRAFAPTAGPLPFYCVQIAPFGYSDERGDATPRLRAAQAKALALPWTGMVVTLDCGDPDDIHPTRKRPVGERLARLALADCYGERSPGHSARSPRATLARGEWRGVRIEFADCEADLVLRGDGGGFELAGADGVFHPAVAAVAGRTVRLTAADVTAPRRARYAWAAAPPWSLATADGLPAAPFELPVIP